MNRSVTEALVERAVRRWQIERRALEERGAPVVDPRGADVPPFWQRPMVTIARDHGALGRRIGEVAASRLGFQAFDRELVGRIAETSHARSALVASLDERLQDRISNWIAAQFGRGRVSDSEYLRGLFEVLLALGQHGEAVVIGRGAEFILDPEATLRVRVFAPFDLRVQRVAERMGVSAGAARERVRQVDAERAAYVRHHFKRERDDLAPYDLLLNTSALSAEVCGDLVATAFRGRFPAAPRPGRGR